jgi:hypothetical protein
MRGSTTATKRASSVARKRSQRAYSGWVSGLVAFSMLNGRSSSDRLSSPKSSGCAPRNSGAKAAAGDFREPAQHVDVVGAVVGARAVRDLVVAEQRAERQAAGRAEFLAVDLVEDLALVDLARALDVARELLPRHVEHAQDHLRAGIFFARGGAGRAGRARAGSPRRELRRRRA